MLAVDVVKEKTGKSFIVSRQLDEKTLTSIETVEKKALRLLEAELPKSELPKWSGIVNPALYGVKTHADIFNSRQRATCLALMMSLKEEYDRIKNEHNEDVAKYTVGMLSGLIDQLVDWNCRMAMWISQNEQVGRAFCGPGISMYWDFNETDPVASGPSNLNAKLKRIIEGSKAVKKLPRKGCVQHTQAQLLPYKDKMFDAIVTDPPYYDNIFYTVLADNFYAWKRILLKHIEPELFQNEVTDFDHELVASTKRNGSGDRAHENYCLNLNKAINEASRVLKNNGVMSFVYSHSSLLGWEAIVRSFRYSPMYFTSVQPLSIERKQRPRAVKSEAINTCIAFIARNGNKPKKTISLGKLLLDFKNILDSKFTVSLENAGWQSEDIAIGLMAHGVAIISNANNIENVDDMDALIKIETLVKGKYPNFKLSRRKSL